MNNNAPVRPLSLMTLLVQVKTAATVQNQLDLLLKAGEFKSFNLRSLTEQEKVKICAHCGSATTPFGPFGDGLELEFSIYGFRVIFRSRELWSGGRSALRHILNDPTYFSPGLNRAVDRLRYHRFLVKPFLQNVGKAVALLSVGLTSYPGIPSAQGEETQPEKTVVQQQKKHSSESIFWIEVQLTSYSWREPKHIIRWGRHNCIGGDLNVPVEGLKQCAADTKIYPLGTVLCIKVGDLEEFRIVTDSGKLVRGAHHLDLHFDSLDQMNDYGTQKGHVMVIRRGWSDGALRNGAKS